MWRKTGLLLVILALILGAILFNRERFKNVFKMPAIKTVETVQPQPTPPADQAKTEIFSWHYKGKPYQIKLTLSQELYQYYVGSSHFYRSQGEPPANWRDDFYGIFLATRPADQTISSITGQLQQQAAANKLTADELVELTMGFVQSIPYDDAKAADKNSQVNFPYETLYKKLGICSDKAVLAVALLRQLGYGAAVLVYPDRDHSSVGIECPDQYALPGTSYCYAETTDFFPIGFVPQGFDKNRIAVNQTIAVGASQFDKVFDPVILGAGQAYQQTHGKVYQGIAGTHQQIDKLKSLENFLAVAKPAIDALKSSLDKQLTAVNVQAAKLDAYKRQQDAAAYNQLLPYYNELVAAYNDAVNNYKLKIDNYNNTAAIYEQGIKALHPAAK